MRSYIYYILVITIFGYCISDEEPNKEDKMGSIKDKIDKLIKDFKNQLPETISIVPLNITIPRNNYISGYINVSRSNIIGVKDFQLDIKYLFNTIPSKFNFSLENLDLSTTYNAELPLFNISLLTIFGKGDFRIKARNIQFHGDIVLTKVANVLLSMEKFELVITGLLNDNDISTELSEQITKLINSMVKTHATQISKFIENLLNRIIQIIINHNKAMTVPPTDLDKVTMAVIDE